MQNASTLLVCGLLVLPAAAAESGATPITFGHLVDEMADLERLARWPAPAYRTVQFSSYDRRSTTAEAPQWFSNADGFGREPVPGFLKVLRPPQDGQAGLYLVAEAAGPGAIVRGWSAGMGGVLRVYLDPPGDTAGAGKEIPVWEGDAYDFLARRSAHYLKSAGVDLEAGDAFIQQDADYFPIPFQDGVKVTWEGKVSDLHFYHLQIRQYPAGTALRTFDPQRDVQEGQSRIRAAVEALTRPRVAAGDEPVALEGAIEPGRNWTWSPEGQGPSAVRELRLRLESDPLDAALRGCLLRISFDGSQRPQVEAPVGDFFASGPGVNPFSSLPFSVDADGTLTSRFVMPFEKSVRVEIVNHTSRPVRLAGSVRLSRWSWDDRSLYFRAKWRADHDLLAGAGVIDLPCLVALGQGVFAGCAVMIMNPSGVPTAGGNWWGEGDEKILIDGELMPSTFGTGTEDYFNYSWSRPDLFDHPYCGQPLDSGPDTAGYISNHRFQVLDAIPFERSAAVLLELWSHNRTPGLSYARVVYHYARPNAIDDHRGLMPADLRIPLLPARKPQAAGGATGARFHCFEELGLEATAGRIETVPFPLATQLRVVLWQGEKGARLRFNLPVEKDGRYAIHFVALHRPDGATVRVLVDDRPLATGRGSEAVSLKSNHAPRVLNVGFKAVDLKAGSRAVTIECIEPGVVGLDYLWERNP
ncbi:MAG TPA: DUF2961 domain-containing protein [Verrucomicrobiota bacterium]|nr:DUF2961 domain-containing protein [Verrucomicrobiota bacterium]HRZ38844.1 DUF2961 domain-containing protein [Candidatus Paceibacterota bacterium]